MRIMLFVRSLLVGGTERQVVALARGLARRGHQVTVASFYNENPLGAGLAAAGVTLISLDKRGRWDLFGFLWRFLRLIRAQRPDILYAFLPIPNLVALLARLACANTRIVWGVRVGLLDRTHYDWMMRLSYSVEGWLARYADLAISNSRIGADGAIALGFPADRTQVVANGIDTERFRPDPQARARTRAEWNLADGTPLIGIVGRLDPQKDIPNFLTAAAALAGADEALRFAVVGNGPNAYRTQLVALAQSLGLAAKLVWAPAREQVETIYNALDLLVLASTAEGTPNVVLEAMSCGISAVVTAAGDAAEVVGDCGLAVPARDPAALADAIRRQLGRRAVAGPELAAACRQRIVDTYATDIMVDRSEALLLAAAAGRERHPAR